MVELIKLSATSPGHKVAIGSLEEAYFIHHSNFSPFW